MAPTARRAAVVALLTAAAAAAQPPLPAVKVDAEFFKKQQEQAQKLYGKRIDDAEAAFKKLAADLGPDDPKSQAARRKLIAESLGFGLPDRALPLLEDDYRAAKAKGPGDPTFEDAAQNLSNAYSMANRFDKLAGHCEEVLEAGRKKHGPAHAPPHLLHMIGYAHTAAGRPEKAVAAFEDAAGRLTADTDDALRVRLGLAGVYEQTGKAAKAVAAYEDVLARVGKRDRPFPDEESARVSLARLYSDAGRHRDALPQYEWLAADAVRKGGPVPDNAFALYYRGKAAACHRELGDVAKALAMFDDALAKLRARPDPRFNFLAQMLEEAAITCDAAGKLGPAEKHLRDLADHCRKGGDTDAVYLARALAGLGLNLMKQRKWADAEPPLRESLAIREKRMPDDWQTFNTKSILGGALLGQGKHADAEPLLAAGYAGLKARAAAIPEAAKPRLREAGDRLANLYDATDRRDRAAAVRKELDAK